MEEVAVTVLDGVVAEDDATEAGTKLPPPPPPPYGWPYFDETPTEPPTVPLPPPEPPPPEGVVHWDAVGVMVYVAWPVDCEIATLATPELHDSDATPPPLDVAMVRSYDGDVSVNGPPVEDESVIATLVAFTVSASATDPAAMAKVVAGDERLMVAAALYVSGAASARAAKARQTATTKIARSRLMLLARAGLGRRCRENSVQNGEIVYPCAAVAVPNFNTACQR
jgi:hypothetical protein